MRILGNRGNKCVASHQENGPNCTLKPYNEPETLYTLADRQGIMTLCVNGMEDTHNMGNSRPYGSHHCYTFEFANSCVVVSAS